MGQQKKAKQEAYRLELMQQMQQQKVQKPPVDIYKSEDAPKYFDKFDEAKVKKQKQEEYRMELMKQMQMKQNKVQIRASNNRHVSTQQFGTSLSPLKSQQNAQEAKRAKQEKYRLELMEQMKEKEAKQVFKRSDVTRHSEMKQREDFEEDRQQKYALELEQQMKLKRLTKMAEKEQEMLEERRNTMNGSFLDGFGNNPIPQMSAPAIPSQTAYKMELDLQMKEKERKSFLEQDKSRYSNVEKEQYQAIGHHDRAQDAKLEKMNQYKRDLDEQRRELQARKDAQKRKEDEEAMRLEQKIKHDREQLVKQKAVEDRDGGIFGTNTEN